MTHKPEKPKGLVIPSVATARQPMNSFPERQDTDGVLPEGVSREFNVAEFEARNKEFMEFILEKYLLLPAEVPTEFEYRDFTKMNYDLLTTRVDNQNTVVLIDSSPIFLHYFENLTARPLLSYSDVTQNGKTLASTLAHAAHKTRETSFLAGIEDMYLLIGGKQDIPEGWKISNKDTRLVLPGMLIRIAGTWSSIYMQIRNNRIQIRREPLSSVYSDARYRFLLRNRTV
jgi:hypothetical protein